MKINSSVKKAMILSVLLLVVVTAAGCRYPTNADGTIKLIYPETTFKETMDSESWFNAILVWPMAQFLNKITPKISVIGALAVLTVLVNGVLLLVTLKSTIAQQQMQLLQPELDKINRKYEGRTDQASKNKQAMEMSALYKKYNVNPISTLVVSFIQFPIVIAMYQAVQRASLVKTTEFLGMNLNTTPMNGIRAGQWGYLVIFIIMGVCQYFSMMIPQKLARKKAEEEAARHHKKAPEQNSQSQMMQYYMMAMILVFGLMWPAAMSVYWTIYSLVNIAKTFIVQKIINDRQQKEGKKA
ncbi:MAG TPA: preprotein translocase YidC [Erysipelotrichaceae bacterium]|nr:preprotein translocase YidC [Erysipelotrichaceae bacterium]